ncbi:MAG: cyclase family protein [Verrucomicrobiota bacterium]
MSLIDLTLTLKPGMRGVDWEPARTVQQDGWNARTLHLYSHCGTHMDAPLHFECGENETIDQTPLSRCLTTAQVVRMTEVKPKELLTLEHLGSVVESFSAGHSLLLQTGWSAYVEDDTRYRLELPRISEELAAWCVDAGVAVLGVEPPSVADVSDLAEVTRIHEILLGGGVTIVEGLINLEALPDATFLFGAFPLKIDGGDGSPCRAWASTTEINIV